MKKLAIMFPGVGYTCVKPLLYYTASAAADKVGGIFEGCNQSLEKKGDTEGNLANLMAVIKKLQEWMN